MALLISHSLYITYSSLVRSGGPLDWSEGELGEWVEVCINQGTFWSIWGAHMLDWNMCSLHQNLAIPWDWQECVSSRVFIQILESSLLQAPSVGSLRAHSRWISCLYLGFCQSRGVASMTGSCLGMRSWARGQCTLRPPGLFHVGTPSSLRALQLCGSSRREGCVSAQVGNGVALGLLCLAKIALVLEGHICLWKWAATKSTEPFPKQMQ